MMDLWSNPPIPGTAIEKIHWFLISLYFTKSNSELPCDDSLLFFILYTIPSNRLHSFGSPSFLSQSETNSTLLSEKLSKQFMPPNSATVLSVILFHAHHFKCQPEALECVGVWGRFGLVVMVGWLVTKLPWPWPTNNRIAAKKDSNSVTVSCFLSQY